ncbi:MAG: hypothetical protein ABI613_07725 [Gemmatimonadota bacterium]
MTVGSLTATLGERVRSRANVADATKLLSLTVQLAFAILVVRAFDFEGQAFHRMMYLASAGFVVNAILPRELRQGWFILISLVSIGVILGPRDGIWLVTVGLALIGLCHLPLSWWARVAIVVLAGAALAITRTGWLTLPFSLSVWPILGSMFMFRLAVYLHHLRHNPTKVSAQRALAYFFMLPNVSFPLFPVIDYKTFDSTYYDQDAYKTYQEGLRYIARGLLHLLAYRFIYYYIARDPAEVTNLGDLMLYVISTYLVYVRVSGQFHIIVGVLHLFGWRMPPANNLYFLATGFTEIWRRNNIYWKDFMMKLVYFPSFFRLRKMGGTFALIGATIMVFVITWLLHSYQWFWIRAEFPLTSTDMAFWGLIGGFMLVEMLRESRKAAGTRVPVVRHWSARRAVKTVGFFMLFSTLWALWDSSSIGDFISLWAMAQRYDSHTLIVAGMILVSALVFTGFPWTVQGLSTPKAGISFWRRLDVQTFAVCAGMLVISRPMMTNLVSPKVTEFSQSLRQNHLNERDAASQHRGYYEQLNTRPSVTTGGEKEANADRPQDWVPLTETSVYRELHTFLGGDLVPLAHADFKGETIGINHWGMRDREYTRQKPVDTYRIVFLGPSDVMGAGVADSQTFENLVEDRLNKELSPATGKHYEILNFSVVSYSMLQQMEMLKQRALGFDPDLIVVSFHPISEYRFSFQFVANMAREGQEIPYPRIKEMVSEAGVRRRMLQPDAFRRMKPYGPELVEWALTQVAEAGKSRGMEVGMFVRDMPAERSVMENSTIDMARSAGYHIFDVRGVYDGQDPATLLLASWDKHPNARGHRLIAERLFKEITSDSLLPLSKPAATSTRKAP